MIDVIKLIKSLEKILDVVMDIPDEDQARLGLRASSPMPVPDSTRLIRVGVYLNTIILDLEVQRDAIERAQLQQATQQPS